MKRLIGTAALAFGLAALAGCSYIADQNLNTGYAVILNEQGEKIGRAVLGQSESGAKVELTVSGLPAASYGVQIHQGGECTGPGFDSVGAPVIETADRDPGAPEGVIPHFLAEFEVSGDGTERTSFTAPGLTFGPGPTSLFAPGGTALVIDRLNPAETYGKHVACGAITRSEPVVVESGVPPGQLKTAEHAHELGTDDITYRQPK